MVIPLIGDFVVGDALGDGVFGEFEGSFPVRVDGPVCFKIASEEIEKCGSCWIFRHFHGVVDAADANAILGHFAEGV